MKLKKNIAVSESGFIFNPTTGDSFSLNPIAQKILKMMKDGLSVDDIKKHFISHYRIDEASFEKDLYDFTSMLRNYKITEDNEKA
jgi:hypothetical protein